MKRTVFLGLLTLMLVLGLVGCDDPTKDEQTKIEYYDYAGVGVSKTADSILGSNGFYLSTVYSGNRASQLLTIVANYPASNSNDTFYRKRTYNQLIAWLDSYRLPHTIATLAKNSLTAYCFYDVNGLLWAVFAEDVSDNYRSIMQNSLLEKSIIPKEGYLQGEAINE
jgi:hypothetical protein